MKKLILLTVLGVSLIANQASASFTANAIVLAGTMTNLVTLNNGAALVSAFTVSTLSGTNSFGFLYDTPTNITAYINPAYTNKSFYATNLIYITTNYYGGTNLMTNLVLIDYTNNVATVTNNYPNIAFYGSSNQPATYGPNLRLYFEHGIWVTNTGAGTINISAVYMPGGY